MAIITNISGTVLSAKIFKDKSYCINFLVSDFIHITPQMREHISNQLALHNVYRGSNSIVTIVEDNEI